MDHSTIGTDLTTDVRLIGQSENKILAKNQSKIILFVIVLICFSLSFFLFRFCFVSHFFLAIARLHFILAITVSLSDPFAFPLAPATP